jgi:DNA-binding SARP family transcriptional activator
MFTPTGVQKLLPILIEAQKRQIQPNYVSQLLTELGLHNVAFHPGYSLRIQTLGHFRIWLDQRELSERAWQRGKAKLLFQLLLTRRHQLLAREEIMDWLWAEQDEETAQRDFKVALNALNKALEPNREARATAFFIQRHGSSYGFNLASGYQLDAEEFERLVASGLAESDPKQAIVLLEKGLAYYQGEYLPDCRYEDWCIEERDRLGVLYLRGAEKLAQAYVAVEQYEASIRWCEKILKTDDCWEEAYRLLMICYHRQNNRSLSLKWYEKCAAKLKEQMGVSPLPSTCDTFYLIMDQK